MKKSQILIVEDDAIVAEHTKVRLKAMGIDVIAIASSGEEALVTVDEKNPDLVLMDIMLEGKMNGIQTADKIRSNYDIPVVYVTAYADEKLVRRAKITSPFGYIIKPFEDNELNTAIEIALYKHKIEKKLRQSEAWLSTMLNSIGDAVIAADTNERITFMNPVAQFLTGWAQEDAVQKPLTQVFHIINEKTGEIVENNFDKVIRKNMIIGLANHTILIAKDGRKIPIADSSAPIRDKKGNINGIVLVFRDIGKRRQSEEKIKQSEKKYRTLISKLPAGFALHEIINDENGNPFDYRFLEVNNAFKKMTGLERNEVVGKAVLEILPHTENYWIETFGKVANTGKSIQFDHYSKELNKYFQVFAYSPEKGQFVSIFYDTTDAKKNEMMLNQQLKMESIGRLAGGVAHDFNNMLSIILGYGESILEQLHQNDPLWKDVKEIVTAGHRSAGLTRQLLAFSRKQTLQPEVLNLNDVILTLEKMLQRVIGEDIHLKLSLANDVGKVLVDPGQIEQVIMNLVVNARDAMPTGGNLFIETSVAELDEIYAEYHPEVSPGIYLLITITDTGCGMETVIKNRIFEPFFTTKDKGKGTGLGLATVYGIVKQSGGHILLYSEPNQGTTFKIYFPQTEEKNEPVKEKDDHQPGEVGGEHILVVEDETSLRKYIGTILRRIGYKVTLAANGGEALLMIEEKGLKPKLILTDVIMPNMSGRELMNRLSKSRPNLKAIYMSGYTDNAIAQHGALDPGTPFIQKPFTVNDIVEKIRTVLD